MVLSLRDKDDYYYDHTILGYNITSRRIYILYTNNNFQTVPYSKETELKLFNAIKRQYKHFKKEVKMDALVTSIGALMISLNIYLAEQSTLPALNFTAVGLWSLFSALEGIKLINDYRDCQDTRKLLK